MSRDRKRTLNWYQINDSEAIARHLERMAERGWLLEKAGSTLWTYRRGEPGPVKYTATCFPEASVFDAAPTDGQETYIDYCRAGGWELAGAYGPLQIFRAVTPDPTPIETDERFKLDAVRRSMGKSFVFSYGLLLASMGLNLWLRAESFRRDPLEFISRSSNLSLTLLLAGMAVYCGAFLADYFIWLFRSRRAVERGGACARVHTRARLWMGWALMALCALTLLGYLEDYAVPGARWILLYAFGGVLLVLAASRGVMGLLKGRGCRRGTTRTAFVVTVAALSVLYAASLPFLLLGTQRARFLRMDREPAYVHTNHPGSAVSYDMEVYRDPLPITLEALGFEVTEEDQCSYRAKTDRSPLAARTVCSQGPAEWSSDLPDLRYEACRIPWGWLRQLCWDLTIAPENSAAHYYGPDYAFPAELPEGALEARRTENGGRYALLDREGIVLICGSWDLTQAQVETIWENARTFR